MGQRVRPTPRVRTRRTNRQEPLLLSSMNPDSFNIRTGEKKSIVCPACGTWRRIMGNTELKVREHPQHASTFEARCGGSNQRVVIDIDVRRWQARQDRLLREAVPAESRRATQQHYKPTLAPAPPVHQLRPQRSPKPSRQAFLTHRRGCATCTGTKQCQDGALLARRYLADLAAEPARRMARELIDGKERAAERRRRAAWPRTRQQQWDRYGGKDIETANNQARDRYYPGDSPADGPHVPTEPLRIRHH